MFLIRNAWKLIFVGAVLLVTAGFVFFSSGKTEENYRENGREVNCTVISVLEGRNGAQTVKGVYTDEKGAQVTAKVIRNKSTYVGENFVGLVVPEEPEQVYCLPEESMKNGLYLLFGGLGALGLVLVILGIVGLATNKRL